MGKVAGALIWPKKI